MRTYEFFEKLAKEVHYNSTQLNNAIANQPSEVQKAFDSSNPFLIHKQCKDSYLAHAITSIMK